MRTTVLAADDIRQIVQRVGLHTLMDELIARLSTAFKHYDPEKTQIPTRAGFAYDLPHTGLIEWMPVMSLQDNVTIKVVGYHPTNPTQHNLPTIISTLSAYDVCTGHLIGLADGTFLTALRTGAASALASAVMASPNAKTIGLIGAGVQAVTQLHALSRLFDFGEVLVYDVNRQVSESFPERVAFLELDLRVMSAEELPQLVETVDILCTATS
ncbi:MAG: ornithine cyclodeaminase family protein, partial [Chloroflexi bacterium]|nr:ornithine cyclodeaminase family protein [Chloroflexota bacterium]